MMSRSDPLVSVVIPTRNRVAYLREALGSVTSQTCTSWECIIVDDASDDGTAEWLARQAEARVASIRLDRPRERSAARNRGLEQARGRFVMFFDDDDRLRPGALTTLSLRLLSHSGCFAAVGAMLAFDEAGNWRRRPHPRSPRFREVWQDVLMGWCGSQGRSLFRTEVIRQVGGWNEGIDKGEDHELWIRLSQEGPVALIPDVVLEHRVHAGQSTVDARGFERSVRQQLVNRLPSDDRDNAGHLLAAWDLFRDADSHFRAGEFRACVQKYLRGIRLTSVPITSPLVRPLWIAPFGRALFGMVFGSRVVAATKAVKRSVETSIRRHVDVEAAPLKSRDRE